EKGLPEIAWRKRAGDSTLEPFRKILQKSASEEIPGGVKLAERPEAPNTIWIGICKHIEQHSFNGDAKSNEVDAFREESVIVKLDRIPVVIIGWAASNSSSKVADTADQHLHRLTACKRATAYAQIDPRCVGINRFQALV